MHVISAVAVLQTQATTTIVHESFCEQPLHSTRIGILHTWPGRGVLLHEQGTWTDGCQTEL